MIEQWKDVAGYEGLYKVSNFGNVLSCMRYVKGSRCEKKIVSERMLRPLLSRGYASVALCKEGNVKRESVHRIVANAFIENPMNYEVVNHKDGNRLNNNVSNLEWCSYKQNIAHAKEVLGIDYRTLAKRNKPIKRNDGVVFCSVNEAAQKSGTTRGNIYLQMHGKRKAAGGYTFQFLCEG